ncbi:MAG: hypothetical protein QM709_09695 [Spongiibacteraceae bacterium]
MKIKALAAAVIAAGLTQSALALPIASAINLHLYASGASAQDKSLQNMAIKMCDTGTVDIYTDTNGKPEGSSYSAFSCTMSPTNVPGLSGTLNVMVHKRSAGGSAWGVGPVAAGDNVPQMDISATNCPSAATPATATINGTTVNVWKCSNATLMSPVPVPDFGISDVEPALFNNTSNFIPVDNVTVFAGDPGTGPIPQAQLDGLTVTGMSAVTFGIPVTLNLRNALQAAQFPASANCVGSDDVNCMPSLTKTQISSLFVGTIGTWSKFKVVDQADGLVKSLTAVTGVTAPIGAGKVNVCRRVNGSGTQAQFNALFLGDGCSKGASLAKGDNSSSSGLTGGSGVTTQGLGTGVLVHENSGSGDVDACLNNLQGGNIWGIGIQSLEKGSANYRFVKVDGVAPTLKNVATNKYWDWAANSIQWRTSAISGDKLTILNKLAAEISTPSDLAILNANFNPRITGTDSQVGLLALNTNPATGTKFATTIPFAASNPVMTATRNGAAGTGAPNTCATTVILNNADSQMIQ